MDQERFRPGLFRIAGDDAQQHRPDCGIAGRSADLGSDGTGALLMAGILALAMAAPGSARAAESGLKVSGSIRVRQEMLDGQYRPGFDDRDDVLVMRSSLLA